MQNLGNLLSTWFLTEIPVVAKDGSPEIRTQDQSVKSRVLYR